MRVIIIALVLCSHLLVGQNIKGQTLNTITEVQDQKFDIALVTVALINKKEKKKDNDKIDTTKAFFSVLFMVILING